MKANLITIFAFVLLSVTGLRAQVYNDFVSIQSKGPMPESLVEHYYFSQYEGSQTPYLRIGKTRSYEVKTVYESLIRSGLIIYGEDVHQLCQDLLREIIHADSTQNNVPEIYPLKSGFVGLLNDGNNTIFIPTIVIAKLKNVEQLYFQIARQVYLVRSKEQPLKMKLNRTVTYDDRFRLMARYDDSVDYQADLYAKRCIEHLGLDIRKAAYSIDHMDPDELIFDEFRPHDTTIVNGIILPEKYLDAGTYRYGDQKISAASLKLQNRRKKILDKIPFRTYEKSALEGDFRHARILCRLQSIEEFLIRNNPILALYTCALMEHTIGSNLYLARMKALSWVTLVQQQANYNLEILGTPFSIHEAPSASYFLAIYRLKHEEVKLLTLHQLFYYAHQYPEQREEFLLMATNLLRIAQFAEGDAFNTYLLARIQKQDYTYTGSTALCSLSFNTIVNNPIFQETIMRYREQDSLPFNTEMINLCYPETNLFKKQTYYLEKSAKQRNYIQEYLYHNDIGFLSMDSLRTKEDLTTSYNTKNLFLRIHQQTSQQTAHKYPVIPVNYFQLRTLVRESHYPIIGSVNLENQYNLNPQGYHLTSLFAIPLPFVITDYFLGGNHTRFFAYLFDSRTEHLTIYEASRYRDPMRKRFIENKLYSTLKQPTHAQ